MSDEHDQTMRRRVAIVGCGYVGSALGAELVRRGHDVAGTTTTPARTRELGELGLTPAVVELSQVDRVHELLANRETVFLTVAAGGKHERYREVYLEGVQHLIRALEGTAVRHVVYTSSTGVYGQTDGQWVDETSPTEPSSERGRVLVAAETALREGTRRLGITGTVVRLAGIYGPGRGPINRVRGYAGQERDDGEAYVNLIHRDDIVRALAALMDRPYAGVLNLADDRPVLRRAYYDALLASLGLPPIRWVRPEAPVDRGKRVRNDRIKAALGLTLVHPGVETAAAPRGAAGGAPGK